MTPVVLIVSSKIEGNDTSCAWFDLSLIHKDVKSVQILESCIYLLP